MRQGLCGLSIHGSPQAQFGLLIPDGLLCSRRTDHYLGALDYNEGEGVCHAIAFGNVMILVQIHTADYTENIPP